jgi:hypothetical protein
MQRLFFNRSYIPTIFSTRYVVAVFIGGAAVFFLVGALAFAHSLSNPLPGDASAFRLLYTASSAAAPSNVAFASAAAANAPLEMHIANNGLVYLKSAVVKSISGSTLTVGIAWGSADFVWTVHSSYMTKLWDKDGQKITLADVQVGDQVRITGALDRNAAEPTVQAQIIRL